MNAEYLGVSRLQLMENAGRAIAEAVKEKFGKKTKIKIICGLGGNGGDGFVAARHLAEEGYAIDVLLLGNHLHIRSEEAKHNLRIINLMKHSLNILEIHDSSEITPIRSDVIIDALIGTGVKGALESPYREMVKAINEAEGFKIAVDIPTGVESDTGFVHSEAVIADLTLTFHKPKIGLLTADKNIGKLVTCLIGVPPEAELYTGPGDVFLVTKKRPKSAHKGDFGRLLVIGGSEMYSGAPTLTALGAYATGIDLVYVAAPEIIAKIIAGFSPSLVTISLKGPRLTSKNLTQIGEIYERVDAVAIGPGLGLHDDTKEAVLKIIEDTELLGLPILLDADALKHYPNKKTISTETLFTPHEKEFEILTGKKPGSSLKTRGETVKKEASKLGGTILLKGNVDIISEGTRIRYNFTGNPGMTVGGTGDVLSGVAAGFMAMGNSSFQAGVAGAFVNGSAGDYAVLEKGYHLEPMDLIVKISKIIEDAIYERMKSPIKRL
jgi:NAD(P)H-hydrate epimerase